MSKRIYGKEYGFQTRAVHTGNDTDGETGAIKRPITMANSYELPYDPSDLNWSSADKSLYTRNGGSNQKYLQEKVASLEGGEDCVVLASGVAAVDTTNPENVKKAIRPNTKLIHIETPGNPTLMISDIRKIAEIAHENGILLSVDNTFASPYNQRPIELGADFTIESLTKYINGHDESLIVFLGEDDERQYLYPEEFHNGFFRFSVGIEDIEDIIGDLEQAFKKTGLL